MDNNELLQAMQQMLLEERKHTQQMLLEQEQRANTRFDKMESRFDKIENTLGVIQEDIKEIKGSLDSVIDWIDEAEHTVEIKFPIKRKSS